MLRSSLRWHNVMIYALRLSALFIAIIASVLASEQSSTPPSGSVEIDKDNPPVDSLIFTGAILGCENTCEFRSSEGPCKVDMRCLMMALRSEDKPTVAGLETGGGRIPEEGRQEEDNEQTCEGKCLFNDKQDKCRLDLICVLDRDVEGTLRYLVDANFDAQIAIQLALSASANRPCEKEDAPGKRPIEMPTDGHCCKPSDIPGESNSCENSILCEDEKDPSIPKVFLASPEVAGDLLHPCPVKCEYMVDGKCEMDYDCMKSYA